MTVLEIVKRKLAEPPADDVLMLDIEEVAQTIMNYCNRDDIPDELKYVHANMVVDFINSLNRSNQPDGNKTVASIKEGDVTVQFKASGKEMRQQIMEQLIFDYTIQLNRFRKLRW